jgi:enolase-phosphatase E1
MTDAATEHLAPGFGGVLLDVEGTTTPIEFVTGTLFPFARDRFPAFLRGHGALPAVRADLERLREEHRREGPADAPPAWNDDDPLAAAISYLLWLMERDRKSTALKSLQGRIWEEGFHARTLLAPVYPDVAPALERWKHGSIDACIFSSGSVLAQRLVFGHSSAGDLTPLLAAFFDTTTGPKREPESYRRIAAARGRAPTDWLFLSDIAEELDAARAAGMQTALVVRPGSPEPKAASHPVVRSFDELPRA